MKTKSKKQKAETSFPKSRMLQFEKESFLCDNGGHDCGVVYRHRGKWLCGPCLKDAVGRMAERALKRTARRGEPSAGWLPVTCAVSLQRLIGHYLSHVISIKRRW